LMPAATLLPSMRVAVVVTGVALPWS
jgi:hypothetical protein